MGSLVSHLTHAGCAESSLSQLSATGLVFPEQPVPNRIVLVRRKRQTWTGFVSVTPSRVTRDRNTGLGYAVRLPWSNRLCSVWIRSVTTAHVTPNRLHIAFHD